MQISDLKKELIKNTQVVENWKLSRDYSHMLYSFILVLSLWEQIIGWLNVIWSNDLLNDSKKHAPGKFKWYTKYL